MNYKQLTKDQLIRIIENQLHEKDAFPGDHAGSVSNEVSETRSGKMQNYRSFFNTIDDFLAVVDEQGILMEINNTMMARTGYDREELIGKPAQMLYPVAFRAEAERIVRDMLAGKNEVCAIPLLTKTEKQITVETRVKRGVWNGKPAVFAVSKDISRLKLSEEKFSKVFYLNPSACGFSDLESGKYLEVNHAFTMLLGYEASEVVGKTATELGILDEQTKNTILDRASPDGNVVNHAAILKTKTGVSKHVLLSAENIFVQDQGIRFTVVTDITMLKEIEQELRKSKEKAEKSDRLKSAFLANMSHEIRTPMNGIIGFADVLRSAKVTPEEQDQFLHIIEESGMRMLKIINDIIDISKIEAGYVKLRLEATNIDEHLSYMCSFFAPEAERKGLELVNQTDPQGKEITIITDGEKLYAILTNLIKNAIKYTETGKITIGYLKHRTDIEFYVSDTGSGIPDEQLNHVFERFTRLESASLSSIEGSGLGLSIAKAYVDLLGGRIWVKSKEKTGSTFHFTIPLQKADQQADSLLLTEPENSKLKRKLKILIAEDDTASELLLKTYLEDISSDILISRDGHDVVEVCRKTADLDLILMDVKLPLSNGYEAVRHIREFNKSVIIIVQTAFALAGEHDKAIQAGCNGFMTKPLNRARLLQEIKRCVAAEKKSVVKQKKA